MIANETHIVCQWHPAQALVVGAPTGPPVPHLGRRQAHRTASSADKTCRRRQCRVRGGWKRVVNNSYFSLQKTALELSTLLLYGDVKVHFVNSTAAHWASGHDCIVCRVPALPY